MADGIPQSMGKPLPEAVTTGLAAGDRTLWDMKNLTSDLAPLLFRTAAPVSGGDPSQSPTACMQGRAVLGGRHGLLRRGREKGDVADGRKQFAALGAYIIILPDKAYYNRLTGEFGSLEAGWSGSAKIQDGTYAEEEAEANTIYASGGRLGFHLQGGDAVTISGQRPNERQQPDHCHPGD